MLCRSRMEIKPLMLAGLLSALVPHAALGNQPPSRPVAIVSIHMVSPLVGWGVSIRSVLHTSDGGRYWKIMRSLGNAPDGQIAALAARDANRAWVVVPTRSRSSSAYPGSVVVSTIDGGRTWRSSRPLRGSSPPLESIGSPSINFVDALHGWVVTTEGAGAGSAAHDLYSTVDGGVTWRLIEYNRLADHASRGSLPSCDCLGGISFQSTRTGWATGLSGADPSLTILYRSADGGRTWRRQKLPLPVGYRRDNIATAPPAFFGTDGVLPVHLTTPSAFVLYRTHNGGSSWLPTTPIRTPSGNNQDIADAMALTARLVWTWVGSTLYRTADGGVRWQPIAHHLQLQGTPEIQFVTPTIGYAGGEFTGEGTGRPYILHSIDGGRIWSKVYTSA